MTPAERMAAVAADLAVVTSEGVLPFDALPAAVPALEVTDEPTTHPLIDDLFLFGELALCVGDGGDGKSSLMLHCACAVAGGYAAFGHFPARQGPVLIVSEEDSAAVMLSRAEAMCRGHGWDRERVLGNLHFLALVGTRLDEANWGRHLVSEVERLGAVFVILDPLYELTSAEENSNREMRPAIRVMRALSNTPTKPAVAVVHHAAKNRESSKLDRVRGATALRDAARLVYFVERSDDGESMTVSCIKASRSERLAPFVIRRHIESVPDNRACWAIARFEYVSVHEAALGDASAFILEQVRDGRLTTTALKDAAKGRHIDPTAINSALKVLAMRNLLDFEPGPRGAKFWGLKTPSEAPADDQQLSLHRNGMQGGDDVANATSDIAYAR